MFKLCNMSYRDSTFYWRRLAVAAIVFLMIATAAYSQTTYATITGTVTDPSGAVVPGANITATNVSTGVKSSAASNQAGNYTIPQLNEGIYSLKAEVSGFKEFVVQDIKLVSRDMRRIDVALQVGGTATSIEVSAGGATLIETETARISDTKDAAVLNVMPMNARWLWAYFEQVPNMVNGNDGYRFAGSTGNQNNWSIDGTTMNDGQGWAIGPQLNYMESYQEVKVDLANNSADFGAIGQVDVITKSGTNDLHGAAFDTYMTPGLRARNFFADSVANTRFHIFGGGVGGPVFIPKLYNGRNKTFFYGSFERSAGNGGVNFLNPTVPLESWRNGDFSNLLPGTVIYDPTTKQPFPGNQIPASRINPVSQAIQDRFYPLPNYGDPNAFQSSNYREAKNYSWQAPWMGTGRIDQHFSEKDFVYGRFNITGGPSVWWEDNLPTIGQHHQYRTSRSATVSYTHVFTPTIINEGRWGMDYNNIPSTGPVNGQEEVQRLGLTGLVPNLPNVPGMLNINWQGIGLQGLTQYNGSDPGFRNHNEHFQDYVSIFRGRHTFKTGVEVVRVEGDDWSIPTDLFGSASFSSRFTSAGIDGQGNPYADFLLGIPTTSSRSYPSLRLDRNRWQSAFFVTDEFRINPKLTLTAGVRYQIHTPWNENHGRLAMFDIASGSIVVPDATKVSPLFPTNYVKVVSASSVGLPNTLIRTDFNDIAPRIGIAWRPFGSKTVFRAGYGIFYDVVPFDITTSTNPFQLKEPDFTNPVNNPQVIFPRVFPETPAGAAYTEAGIPTAVNPNLATPWSQQYNFTIEHERWNTGFRLSYIGTAQRQGTYSYNYNSPVPDDRPYIDKTRPFMQYPDIMYRTNGAGHQYNALSAEVKRSMAKGLYYQLAWTWARDRYDMSRYDSLENPFDRQREVAVAPDIPTHRIESSFFYELPFGRGRRFGGNVSRLVNLAVGGWVLSGTYGFDSGRFLTPYWSGPDPTGTRYTTSDPAWVTIRPDQIGNPNLPSGQQSINGWFDPAAFTAPQPGRFGSAAKGVIKGPHTNVWNAGIQKQMQFSEKTRLILEMTSRNVFNHPNWSNPDTNISNGGSVGRITWAGGIGAFGPDAREERLGIRLEF